MIMKKPSRSNINYSLKFLSPFLHLKVERDRKRNVKFIRVVIEEEIFEVNTNTSPSLVMVPMGCYLDTSNTAASIKDICLPSFYLNIINTIVVK